MSPSAYDAALQFWYGRTNFEVTSPVVGDLKLDRMRQLLRLLGNPQDRLRIVHLAGTKGKGSTSAFLVAILQQAGYRVGLFTSPHLVRVEERFQVAGRPISADELVELLHEVRSALETARPRLEPTFFEIATAVGLLFFVRRRADVVVLEVGLGGRLDSTNVCTPLVSVITSISMDHTKQLGTTLPQIAREKAGIIKPGRPVVSGVLEPQAQEVIVQLAAERRAPLYQLGRDFHYTYQPGRVQVVGPSWGLSPAELPTVQLTLGRLTHPLTSLGLLGEHQARNASCAGMVTELLRRQGWAVQAQHLREGLAQVSWPARLEIVQRQPMVVLDCAHNVASAQALVAALQASFPPAEQTLILAISADKDVAGICRMLLPHFRHVLVTSYQSSQRGVPVEVLLQLASELAPRGTTVQACDSPSLALSTALRVTSPTGRVVATGSVFLAGELRPIFVK